MISRRLMSGDLRAVYHGSAGRRKLQELTRTYTNLTEDGTRVMLRLKAIFRARAIRTPGERVYSPALRAEWLAQIADDGARFRAHMLYTQLDVLRELRPKAKAAMIAEARRDPAWRVLCAIPFFGPVRAALLLATMKTPWRFRTKRNLWAYAGLAVVTHSTGDHEFLGGKVVRRRRKPLTRGLNQNHSRILKHIFKGAAVAALTRPGELRDLYLAMVARGIRPDMARLTLARKFAALTLRLWKTGERYDPACKCDNGVRSGGWCRSSARSSRFRMTVRGEVSIDTFAGPKVMSRHEPNHRPARRTRTSVQAAPSRVSNRTMVRLVRPSHACNIQWIRS